MSNWLKKQGAKIVIKFTENLLGVVLGNHTAFTVTGQEPLYIKFPSLELGPLVAGDYEVESVERYPIPIHYEEDFVGGTINDVEVVGQELKLESIFGVETEDTYDTSELTGSAYTVVANRMTFKQSGNLIKVKVKTKTSGNYTLNIESDNGSTTHQTHTISDALADSWITFEITSLAVSANDQYRIEIVRPSGTAYAASGLYDGTLWQNREGVFGTGGFSFTNAMGFVFADTEYALTGDYTPPPIDATTLPANVRIRWTADAPIGTSVKIEYSLTELNTAPGTWVVVNESEVITLNNNYLWLKYTLETTDDSITPILNDLWLEQSQQDMDKVLLTMKPLKRFQNLQGNLTVNYDSVIGSLEGAGGDVQSFEQVFTPADLERMPNPLLTENIVASITDYILNTTRLYHLVVGDGPFPTDDYRSQKVVREYDAGPPEVLEQEKGEWGPFNNESLAVSITDYTLTLIHVEDIDP